MLLLCILMTTGTAFADDVVKIGAVLSVTGPASFIGEPEKNSIEMVRDAINASGGVLGKKIEVIIYDDESNVNKAVLSVDKLIKKDRVAVVLGPSISGNTLAVMNKFPAAKIPMVSCAAAEKIIKPVNPWVFKVAPSDRFAVQKILSDAKAKGYKKLAIITVSDGFGQAGREELKDLIPSSGFELVADEVYGPKDTDMTAQLTKIKEINPDAIICWGTNPGPAVIARNRVQLGMTTPLYMSHGVASKKFIELAGEAAEGLLLPAGHLLVASQLPDSDPQKAVLLDYTKRYTKMFKKPVSTFGGHGSDSLNLAVKAMENGGSTDSQAIRDNLEKIQNFAGIGGVFSFTPEDHVGLDENAFIMVVIENGEWKIAQK
ncbi:ABC transporter substrate-binding protein [Desulfovibrio inopinatus]|uniref:ABC transporter substrate-binding protein n=1 Tax=Desulfovibrio inopinatus TaxID=102109 RepID=UPI003CCB924F